MTETITVPAAALVQEADVVLLLENEEAQLLADILANVCGNPETTRRRIADDIGVALRAVGFDFKDAPDMEGDITFTAVGE